MKTATARACANIAVVKYWGKADLEQNLPAAPSVSVTLDALQTTTTVTFSTEIASDEVTLDDTAANPSTVARVSRFLDRVRALAGTDRFARVATSNNFPTAAGLASSASGFAALAVAASHAAGLDLSPAELSRLARQGSGSAARSLFGGFVKMNDGDDASAEQIAPSDHWDLNCLICLTETGPKKIGSTQAMERTRETSPYYNAWIADANRDTPAAIEAILARDFDKLAKIAERSCLRMHACAAAADPGILYWRPNTIALMHEVREMRDDLNCFFTIDAGPHVKVFCHAGDSARIVERLKATGATHDVLVSRVGNAPSVDVS